MSKLYYRYGTMGSGKTIDLLKVAYNYEERGKKCILIVPSTDTRYGIGKVTTRIGLQRDALVCYPDTNVFELVNSLNEKVDCVIVDECNFLTKNQVIQLSDVVDFLDIPVICYGLRTDFRCELFEGSLELMAIADKVEEIKTICECGKKAVINMRYKDGQVITYGNKIEIGGNDMYKSVCRKCYKKYINEKSI